MEDFSAYPLVSVVITTRNRASLLPRAIQSVLSQTYPRIELIVVDDFSSDETPQILRRFSTNPNIICIRNLKKRGGNASRNIGIGRASGYYITGLDDDDEFLPKRIQLLVEQFDRSCSFVTSRSMIVEKLGQFKSKFQRKITLDDMLFNNLVGNQILTTKENFIGAGLFDENLVRYQDYDMWFRIIQKYGPGKMIEDVTQVVHREHMETSNNFLEQRLAGALGFYNKHKRFMNRSHRKIQLFTIRKLQDKKPSVLIIRRLFHPKIIKPLIKVLLSEFRNRTVKNK